MNMTPLKIGNVQLKNNLVMAPLAGITDLPFRTLAKEGGAGLVCTEMVSAKALVYNDHKSLKLMKVGADERPVSVQIFGGVPADMAYAAKVAEDNGADIVDINMGCPVRKIVKSGAGVKVLDNEKNLVEIMEAVVKSVKVPVTIKIRIGREPGENLAPRIIELAEQAGVKMVALHGRPASAGHSGPVDFEAVAEAVRGAKLPVVGNGGITDELSAKEFLERTGCAGLMIGRGAIGDPELFGRVERFLSTGQIEAGSTWERRIDDLKKHARLAAEYYGEKIGIVMLRKVAPFYFKGLPNAAKMRGRFNYITSLKELDDIAGLIGSSSFFSDAEGFE